VKDQEELALLENIRAKILADPANLETSKWHTSPTVHCLGGWAQRLAGDMKKSPTDEVRRLIPSAGIIVYASNRIALAWLKTRAWMPEKRAAFHTEMRNAGVHVFIGKKEEAGKKVEVEAMTEGEAWAEGNAVVMVTGGELWAIENARITSAGGRVMVWNPEWGDAGCPMVNTN